MNLEQARAALRERVFPMLAAAADDIGAQHLEVRSGAYEDMPGPFAPPGFALHVAANFPFPPYANSDEDALDLTIEVTARRGRVFFGEPGFAWADPGRAEVCLDEFRELEVTPDSLDKLVGMIPALVSTMKAIVERRLAEG